MNIFIVRNFKLAILIARIAARTNAPTLEDPGLSRDHSKTHCANGEPLPKSCLHSPQAHVMETSVERTCYRRVKSKIKPLLGISIQAGQRRRQSKRSRSEKEREREKQKTTKSERTNSSAERQTRSAANAVTQNHTEDLWPFQIRSLGRQQS
jgi:hypothetical protein